MDFYFLFFIFRIQLGLDTYIYIYIYIFFFPFFFFWESNKVRIGKTKLQQSWSLDSDWTVRKQFKTIPKKRRKKVTLHVDLGLLKQIHIYFVSPKRKIWFWRPKSISPYENFLNWSTERDKKKKPRSRVSGGATLDSGCS